MSLPPEVEEQRLKARWDNATANAAAVNLRASEVYAEVAKEKTQYFEKIALASAGTIALVVSFVGSHAGKLQPSWLLRSALIVLVFAMIAAMFRNWIYPYYLMGSYAKQEVIATRHQEQCRLDMLVGVSNALSLSDGKPIDIEKARVDFGEMDKSFEGKITELQKQEDSALKKVKFIEPVVLALVVIGMALLIALAWKNF